MTPGTGHEDAGSGHDALSHLPRLASLLLPRPRLLAKLSTASPLTLLCAPIGFGKTTLVLQWLRTRSASSAESVPWLRVSDDAAEPAGFWAALLEALLDAGITIPAATAPERPARAQVRRALKTADHPVVVVLDGFERITSPGIDRDLLDLLRDLPRLRLIVCLRNRRHFRRHDYVDIDATVITANDLLLTVEEIANLLETVGVPASNNRARAIHAEGGGWPEPTRAGVIALCESAGTTGCGISDTETATRIAQDYLRARLIPEIVAPDLLDFALALSLPETVPAGLAHLLAGHGTQSAKSWLEWLEAQGVLWGAVEDGELVYRWPPAARRALSAELHQRDPQRVHDLHPLIADWYRSQDQPGPALRHAIAAQSWELAVQIIDTNWRHLILHHHDVLFAAFAATPLRIVATSPRALAVRDLRLQMPDDHVLSAIAPLPQDSDELADLGRAPEAGDTLDTALAALMVLSRRGLFDQAREYSKRLDTIVTVAWVAHTADVTAGLPGILLQIGTARMLSDDLDAAPDALRRAHEYAPTHRDRYVERDAAGKLALLHALEGDLTQASTWLERHNNSTQWTGWLQPCVDGTAQIAQALIDLDRLDVDAATTALEAATKLLSPFALWPFATYARATVALHAGDAAAGLRHLDQARATHSDELDPGSTARPLLASIEADLLLALGRGNHARAALEAAGPNHPALRVALARLALLAGRPDTALEHANDFAWTRTASNRHQVSMLLINAVARHRLDHHTLAAQALHRAVTAARRHHCLSPFTTVPRSDLRAIARHLPPATSTILDLPALHEAPDLFPASIDLIELTARERLILGRIADGVRVTHIADELYISTNTVKTHLRSLYRKLNADSRDQAIAHAKANGLLT